MKGLKRFFTDPDHHYFLFGPRGTGKTWWTYQAYSSCLRMDLLESDLYRELKGHPEHLLHLVEGNLAQKYIVIDEIQKVPELLDVVHALIEKHPQLRFVLTGSSARKLRQKGVNLLGGRALNRSMHPYMAAEMNELFSLNKALNIGMLPLAWASQRPEDLLHAYITTYIQQEVQAEGLARNIGAFSRFLETISFSQGSLLNVSNIARESGTGRKAVEGYITILEDLMLGFRLDVFRKKAQRALVGHPKFFFFDCGVFRAIRPKGPFDKPEEIDGSALETLVAQHLRAWCAYSKSQHQIYFWQTEAKTEVDFIVYGESGIYAIEVKNSNQIKQEFFKGLKSFAKDYPMAQKCLIYRGKFRQKIDDVLCIPAEEFLLNLRPDNPILDMATTH